MDYRPILFLIGRILLGGYFLRSAYNHFRYLPMMAGYAGSKGVPVPKLAVAGSGLLLLIGGLGILLGVWISWAVLALALFLIPVTFKMHNFWKDTDQVAQMNNSVNFFKNLALLGAILILLMIPEPWEFSL